MTPLWKLSRVIDGIEHDISYFADRESAELFKNKWEVWDADVKRVWRKRERGRTIKDETTNGTAA